MKEKHNIQALRKLCFNAETFTTEILDWIENENLWNLWVPKEYGGRESAFTEGLQELKHLAKIDGSLGWTVTLCSGANYFIGNLKKKAAAAIFSNPRKPVCFGGSGGISGIAEKIGNQYKISGKWRYATGAPYLTHFTLNAKIIEDGKELKEKDGSPKFRSFILPKKDVKIIADWDTMGLNASVTHSFEVNAAKVHEKFSFRYDQFYLPQSIFKIPFSVFADLTLWVNYIGMAEHFMEEAEIILPQEKLKNIASVISLADQEIAHISEEIGATALKNSKFTTKYIEKVHKTATESVHRLSYGIIKVFPLLGIKAVSKNYPLNQIFRDYFTATQHKLFAGK